MSSSLMLPIFSVAKNSIGRNCIDEEPPSKFSSEYPVIFEEALLQTCKGKGKGKAVNDILADEEYAAALQGAYRGEVVPRLVEDLKFEECFRKGIGDLSRTDNCQDIAARNRAAMLINSVANGLPGPSKYASNWGMRTPVSPLVDLEGLTLRKKFGRPPVYCFICRDLTVAEHKLRSPCGHHYCANCVRQLVRNCIRNETLYPPACCDKGIPHRDIMPLLTAQLNTQFESKRMEFEVQPSLRVFCPQSQCFTFLGSSALSPIFECNSCRTTVCSSCKQIAHRDKICSDGGILKLKILAGLRGLAKCPLCQTIIERISGCDSVYCRCGNCFSYQACECSIAVNLSGLSAVLSFFIPSWFTLAK